MNPRPLRRERICAFSYYLGVTPVLWALRRRPADGFARGHFDQASALLFVLLALVFGFVATVSIASYVLIHFRGLYESVKVEPLVLSLFRKLLLVWAVFQIFGAGSALKGSNFMLPGLGWLVRRRIVLGCALGVWLFAYVAVLLLIPTAVFTSRITRDDLGPADVYILFEDVNRFPRWMFTLALFPAAKAGLDEFGPETVVVTRLTQKSLATALANGRFVFIGSHGKAAGMLLEKRWVPPQDIAVLPKNPDLRYVYLAGCDSGTLAEEWRAALAPAEVKTYDRLTAVIEHLWWVWREAPGIIHRLG